MGNPTLSACTSHLEALIFSIPFFSTIFFHFYFQIANKKYKIAMNPVDVLNFLGKHGFRVIGFTAEADQKMVWTLEEKDFENKIMNSGHGIDHIHH